DVARLHPGSTGRTIFGRLTHDRAAGIGQANAVSDVLADVLNGNAKIAAGDRTVFNQLTNDLLDRAGRDGEGDTDIATVGRIDGGVDANHFTIGVKGRATRVAGVHGSVDLQEVTIVRAADITASAGDHANGHSATQTKGVTDGHDPVTDAACFVFKGHEGE